MQQGDEVTKKQKEASWQIKFPKIKCKYLNLQGGIKSVHVNLILGGVIYWILQIRKGEGGRVAREQGHTSAVRGCMSFHIAFLF